MRTCANCCGPFGLSRRTYRGLQFCCVYCEAEWWVMIEEQRRHVAACSRLFALSRDELKKTA